VRARVPRWATSLVSSRSGRPRVPLEIRRLIREMSLANPLWGAPRIHGELLKLGINIGQTSVAKYMARHRRPRSAPSAKRASTPSIKTARVQQSGPSDLRRPLCRRAAHSECFGGCRTQDGRPLASGDDRAFRRAFATALVGPNFLLLEGLKGILSAAGFRVVAAAYRLKEEARIW
jgi:hypothetical protein